jgi:hypothetical protein
VFKSSFKFICLLQVLLLHPIFLLRTCLVTWFGVNSPLLFHVDVLFVDHRHPSHRLLLLRLLGVIEKTEMSMCVGLI